MKIHSMTATFGKLENQTLSLQPGLNVIQAPDEWGKSTWCAFLVNMLYGLETRVKSTKTTLADKERYAPWSGSPMSGRIDLNWNGRDITIERWTKGRTPMGEFRAYETESGIAVPELTATTCGEVLLGVERSVFLRSGFLRLTDLPVTEDDALRRRLNALVTTGDESDAGDALAQKLKDLKNKCRSNRSNGLIPQAEAQKGELEGKLRQLQEYHTQSEAISQRLQDLQLRQQLLENHRAALAYADAQDNLKQVEQAEHRAEAAAKMMAQQEDACAQLISKEEISAMLQRRSQLLQSQAALMQEWNRIPEEPALPTVPERYRDVPPEDAERIAQEHLETHAALEKGAKNGHKVFYAYLGMVALLLVVGFLCNATPAWIAMAVAFVIISITMLVAHKINCKRWQQEMEELTSLYPGINPDGWLEDARQYAASHREYEQTLQIIRQKRDDLRVRVEENECARQELLDGLSDQTFVEKCNWVIAQHDALLDVRKEYAQASSHAAALRGICKPVERPEFEDSLTYSSAETHRMLEDNRREMQLLQQRLGQYQGMMDTMGQEEMLRRQLEEVNGRLRRLSDTYAALELALSTLADATAQLQRRFAPRIAKEAQSILSRLTDGRYDRLSISQDMSLSVAAQEEAILRESQRRSEGTVDQIYLALRLAVSRELMPHAPFILDDALVRFDDTRHAAAMDILKDEADSRQIILFTCQSREVL